MGNGQQHRLLLNDRDFVEGMTFLPLSLAQVQIGLSFKGISQFLEELMCPRTEPCALCALCLTVTMFLQSGTTTRPILQP